MSRRNPLEHSTPRDGQDNSISSSRSTTPDLRNRVTGQQFDSNAHAYQSSKMQKFIEKGKLMGQYLKNALSKGDSSTPQIDPETRLLNEVQTGRQHIMDIKNLLVQIDLSNNNSDTSQNQFATTLANDNRFSASSVDDIQKLFGKFEQLVNEPGEKSSFDQTVSLVPTMQELKAVNEFLQEFRNDLPPLYSMQVDSNTPESKNTLGNDFSNLLADQNTSFIVNEGRIYQQLVNKHLATIDYLQRSLAESDVMSKQLATELEHNDSFSASSIADIRQVLENFNTRLAQANQQNSIDQALNLSSDVEKLKAIEKFLKEFNTRYLPQDHPSRQLNANLSVPEFPISETNTREHAYVLREIRRNTFSNSTTDTNDISNIDPPCNTGEYGNHLNKYHRLFEKKWLPSPDLNHNRLSQDITQTTQELEQCQQEHEAFKKQLELARRHFASTRDRLDPNSLINLYTDSLLHFGISQQKCLDEIKKLNWLISNESSSTSTGQPQGLGTTVEAQLVVVQVEWKNMNEKREDLVSHEQQWNKWLQNPTLDSNNSDQGEPSQSANN